MKRSGLSFAIAALLMTACADKGPVGVDSGTETGDSVIKRIPPAPKTVPFSASWTTSAGPPPAIDCGINDPDWVVLGLAGVGEATHLGPNTWVSRSATQPDGPGQTGCVVFTADNGDELFMEFTGTTAFAPPSTVSGSGTWEFDGGTGRFSTATGTGTYEFTYDLVANVGNLTQVGTISR